MELFAGLGTGFQTILQPGPLLYCFVGVFVGTLTGVLPGIGAPGAIALLFPYTFHMDPVSAIIMLAGIYYGAMYGGSTTSILVNIPGEASAVVTCLEGYQMALRGRAGPALGISALGSLIAGTFSVLALMLLIQPLTLGALKFGAADYFSVTVLSMALVVYLVRGSALKAAAMVLFGFLLRGVGVDAISGNPRFTFGIPFLLDGIGVVPLAMGLFGIAEVFENIEKSTTGIILKEKIKNLLPSLEDWKRSIRPIMRGTLLGFGWGILPGGGSIVPTFVSYSLEKRFSKHPEEFGKGAIEGVAGPESANNAGAGGAFVPLFAFGIPPNVTLALLLAAFITHGITPGPMLVIEHPKVFWGVIASMYIGNIMLVLLNLPLIGMWVKVLKIPYRILMPLIVILCITGTYVVDHNPFDVIVMAVFGLIGYVLRKFHYEEAPLVLAFILGPLLETNFRKALIISSGDLSVFLSRPISAVALLAAALLLGFKAVSSYRRSRKGP